MITIAESKNNADYPVYLKESRKHLENATRNVSGLPLCCGLSGVRNGLNQLWQKQMDYESRLADMNNPNMGWLPFAIIGGLSILGISAKSIYDHYSSSKQYDQYTTCLNKMLDQGYDPEKAREICVGQRNDIADALHKMGQAAKVVFVGGIVLGAVYLFFKLRK